LEEWKAVHSTVLLPISVNTAHIVIYIQCLWKRTNQPGLEIKIVQKKKKIQQVIATAVRLWDATDGHLQKSIRTLF